jgi:hypothetical protein
LKIFYQTIFGCYLSIHIDEGFFLGFASTGNGVALDDKKYVRNPSFWFLKVYA